MTGLIGGLTSLAGSVIGGSKAKKASKKSQAALDAAYGAASANTAQAKSDVSALYDPYKASGAVGLAKLTDGIGSGELTRPFGASDFAADPGYAFRQAEGQKAIDRRAAADGSYFAPATLKSLSNYAGDEASQEYDNAYQRFTSNQNSAYQKLMGLTQLGYSATGADASNITGSTDAANRLTLGQAGADASAIADRGAISAAQWVNGVKAAGTIATSLIPGAAGGGGALSSISKLFA